MLKLTRSSRSKPRGDEQIEEKDFDVESERDSAEVVLFSESCDVLCNEKLNQTMYGSRKAIEWMRGIRKLLEYIQWMQTWPWGTNGYPGKIIKDVQLWGSYIVVLQQELLVLLSNQWIKDRLLNATPDKLFWLRSTHYEKFFSSAFKIVVPIKKNLKELAQALRERELGQQRDSLEGLEREIKPPTADPPQFPKPFVNPSLLTYEFFKERSIKSILVECSTRFFSTDDFNNIRIPILQENVEDLGKNEAFFILRSFYTALCEMSSSYQDLLKTFEREHPVYTECLEWMLDRWILNVQHYIKQQLIPVFRFN